MPNKELLADSHSLQQSPAVSFQLDNFLAGATASFQICTSQLHRAKMINLTYWDMALGFIAIASFLINILQYFKYRQIQYHARGIYSQLWDIIVEIDRKGVKSVEELKRLINQVRIETIALNHTLGTDEKVIQPWDFGIEQSRARFRREMDWKKEKSSLEAQLQETKKKESDLIERLREAESEVEKRK